MSLSSSLASVGRALAYYPELSKFFGSVNASIFFAQLHYWQQRCASDELGVYKTATEWEDETGLSYREQATARKILVGSGFLIETHKRLQHRVYYQLNLPAVDAAFEVWTKTQFPNDENAIRETTKAQSGKRAKRSSGDAESATRGTTKAQSVNKTEITSKTTTETTAETLSPGAEAPAEPMIVTAGNGTIYEIPAELKYPGPDTKSHKAWIAYAIAYHQRYNAWPRWNQTCAGQITQFIGRVGADLAPRVAVHYVRRVNEAFIVKEFHSVGLMLQNAEKWATQFQTGATMTSTQAKQADQTSSNFDAIEEAKRLARERVKARGGSNV